MGALDWLALGSAVVLGLTWAGYPLGMRLLAALRGAAPAAAPEALSSASVSVILATRDAPARVRERVENLLTCDVADGRFEVLVVVDPGAPWQPTDLAIDDPRVRVIAGDQPGGKAAALNAGVQGSSGEYLIFADSAQRFEPDTIVRLVRELATSSLAAVSGSLELPAASSRLLQAYWAMERRLRRDESRVHSAIGVTGAVWGMRRALWSPLPAGLILDDLYTPMRLILEGHRVGFAAEARAHDPRVTSSGDERRRKVRTLVGNFQLCAWLPAVLAPWRNPVWLQFVMHKLLRLLTPWLVLAIGWWVIVRGGTALLGWGGARAVIVVLLVAGWGLFSPDRLARGGRTLGRWAWDLGSGVALATLMGLRGQWRVWDQ